MTNLPYPYFDRSGGGAFHNNPLIKSYYLERVKMHRKSDQMRRGQYWQKTSNGKYEGCGVACTIHSSDHHAYEYELGLPEWLALVEDRLFERMTLEFCYDWPINLLAAITPGASLDIVKVKFLSCLLSLAAPSQAGGDAIEVRSMLDAHINFYCPGVSQPNPPPPPTYGDWTKLSYLDSLSGSKKDLSDLRFESPSTNIARTMMSSDKVWYAMDSVVDTLPDTDSILSSVYDLMAEELLLLLKMAV